ncbi:MAG: glycosyltransferase [Acidobacteriaceae bacterium]|nr:glycosyltransferase [Acidobacteriaceae bacterium]
MESPDVSLIIAVRNGARWIDRCIRSLLALQYPRERIEILCVDNGSSDRTLDILRGFRPVIRILHESRRGPGAARNCGARAASAPLIAFTDCDCIVDPLWLSNLLKPLRSGTHAAVGGKILARQGAGSVELFGELVHDHANAIQFYRPPYLIGMNMAVRKDLFSRIGMFDESWTRLEDVDLAFRILKSGENITYCPQAVVHHHNRDTLAKLAREGFLHGYYRPSFLRQHRAFIDSYCNKPNLPAPVLRDETLQAELILRPWQIGLYWKIFKCGKHAGELVGRRFPPAGR